MEDIKKLPTITLKKTGDKYELKDVALAACADKDVFVKSAKCTVAMPAGHLAQILPGTGKVTIVAISADTKVSFKSTEDVADFRVLCDVTVEEDPSSSQPFDLSKNGYDETKFERGQKFHYEGTSIREIGRAHV